MEVKGIFLINKPVGMTSHDVVDELRQVTGEQRIGHAGTLDPLASGLMLVAIGKAYTTQLDRYVGLNKEYAAEVTLGQESATYDAEGKLTPGSNRQPTEEEVQEVLNSFIGKQNQMPPIFSAKKIKGKKAYELARAGEEVAVQPKEIEIFKIELTDYSYPIVKFTVQVSSGTYIRSLAHDIGQKLGTGAYLSGLIRTKIGEYELSAAINLDEIKSSQDIINKGIDTN